MKRLQTQVVLQVLLRIRAYVIGRMSIIQVHVDILNIISDENMSVCTPKCVYEKTTHRKLLSSPDTPQKNIKVHAV